MDNGASTDGTGASASAPPLSVVSKKNRPSRPLPTDRIAFGKQLNVLRAYAVASEQRQGGPVTYKEVADLVKMHQQTPALATPFFADINLLVKAGQQGFTPAPEVMAYAQAYQWNSATAAMKLAPILVRAWFCQALLPTINLNGSMSVEEAITELSIASGASTEYRAKLDTILDFMAAAGIVAREGNALRRTGGSTAVPTLSESAGEKEEPDAMEATRIPVASPTPMISSMLQGTQGTVRFNVSVVVDMEEFAGWQPERITAFFGGIAQVLAAKAAVERQVARQ